jgi:hypothetical protein
MSPMGKWRLSHPSASRSYVLVGAVCVSARFDGAEFPVSLASSLTATSARSRQSLLGVVNRAPSADREISSAVTAVGQHLAFTL